MLNQIAAIHGTGVAASTNSYESIQTVTVGSGGSSSIDFTSIPSTYKHLQIRAITRNTGAFAGTLDNWMRFNSDSGSNYSFHSLLGDGSAAAAGSGTSQTRVRMPDQSPGASSTSNTFGAAVIDILDYTSTNKNKTVRALYGANDNTTNSEFRSYLVSGLWYATPAAITSITILPETATFAQYSSFALYGIKG